MSLSRGRKIYDFCRDWRFMGGEQKLAQYDYFDDSDWRSISVPHDWSIEGRFSVEEPSCARGGYLPCGIGWYRKSFATPEDSENKRVELEFDGIFRCATVYINGIEIGFRPYGYVPQCYEISKYLYRDGRDNLVAVRVDNSDQPGHRYYSGSGIYREVRLIVRDRVHIKNFAPFITTEGANENSALIGIKTTVNNSGEADTAFRVCYQLFDAECKLIAKKESAVCDALSTGDDMCLSDTIEVLVPQLWCPENPYLYTLETTLYGENGILDSSTDRVGIRTIEYNAEQGFLLNGKKVFMYGVCLHHDNGALGAVTNRRAEQRKLEIMKEMGCNAVRVSHNPFSRGFYDLCDEMGILVMDEAFDEWRLPKCVPSLNYRDKRYKILVRNYYKYFDRWHKADLEAMLYRDRNHPSIVMWSIGNEISEQRYNVLEGNDTAMILSKIVKQLDPTRPVTCACCFGVDGCIDSAFTDALDVIGYNYGDPRYEKHAETFPDRPFIGTETTSHTWFKKRGVYDPHIFSYKNEDGLYSNGGEVLENSDAHRIKCAERSWMRHKKCDGVAGLFIWTGMDYLGEPTPHIWPSRSSYFAPVDTCGFKKDSFYFYQSEWCSEKAVLHLAGHWNWEGRESEPIDVTAFTNCDSVELFLNGKSQGVREYDAVTCEHLLWSVPFKAGELTAIGYKGGKRVAEHTLTTTGKPYAIHLTADRDIINAACDDLSYITAEIVDKNGLLVPIGECDVTFTVDEGIEILGIDNGDPEYIGSLKANHIPTLSGKCLCILGEQGIKGEFKVKAEAKGLKPCSITVKCQ